MAFARAAAFRNFYRATKPTTIRSQVFRQVTRRSYASGRHESAKAGGDAVWAAGAIAVTVPTCWYLLSNGPGRSEGHGDHGNSLGASGHDESEGKEDDEGEEAEEAESEQSGDDEDDAKEKPEAEDAGKDDDSAKDESENSDDGESESKDTDTPDISDDVDDAKSKNTVTSIPDAKGGSKKRIESDSGIKQDGDASKDQPSPSKTSESKNTQSGKQEGLSNTDTKHPSDPQNSSQHSKKGEGSPETAKSKGTVDSSRPAK